MAVKNRKKVEELVFSTLDLLDPSGKNTKKYKEIFSKMSDNEFVAYFKKMKDDDTMHFYVETELYGDNKITMNSIENAAKHLNLPLEEYIYVRHKDGKVIRSPMKVPVMYLHLKRMQQLLSKKVKSNVDIDSGNVRSRITGGLNSSSKSGRFTDTDTQILASVTSETKSVFEYEDPSTGYTEKLELSPIMTEVLHYRGDDNSKRNKLNQDISLLGTTTLLDLDNKIDPTINKGQGKVTLDVYYLGAGLASDLISYTYLSKQGSKN